MIVPTITFAQDNGTKDSGKIIPPLELKIPSPEGPPYGTIVMMQKPVSCNDTPIVENYIENTGGMTPITFGTTLNEMGGVMSLIQMYANPINKQFAVVEHFATQKSCIITHGSDFDIILPAQKVPN